MNILPYLDVLVLEADPLSCVLACERLRLLGFAQVHAASGSGPAASILRRHRPALVLVDLDEDRAEFCRVLADPHHAGTLVIATSFQGEDRPRMLRHRADAFLRKPYSKAQLLRTISDLLAGAAGRRCKLVRLEAGTRAAADPGRSSTRGQAR